MQARTQRGCCFDECAEPRTSQAPPLYFLFVYIVGNLLLFNLFIAILLSNFELSPEEDE